MKQQETRSLGALSLFGSLREIGHKAEDDILTWSQGLAFHYSNFLEGLSGVEEEQKKKILQDVWSNVAEKAPKAKKTAKKPARKATSKKASAAASADD